MNFMTLELGYEQYTPPNTAPTNINLSASSIQENNAVGAVIGTFSTTDAEAGAMAYSLVTGTGDTDNASFKIDGASLKADYAFDFEAKSSYNIRVRSTDSGGLFFEKEFTISVTNVSEAAVLPTSGTTAPVLVGTKVVGKLTVDPRTNGVTYNGQSLPKGSILRNTADGKKFLKVTGDSKAFTAIEVTPKAEWNYSTGADAAWEVLQDA
jgi:hypothetical protein